jgi:hypothetical protein
MRFKGSLVAAGQAKVGSEEESAASDVERRDGIRTDLEARGVDPVAAESLAQSLCQELDRNGEAYDAALDGVALGFRAQDVIAEQLAKSAGDLQEIERLMGSFASELSKLDEVLEVLAAYLRRLRTAAPANGDRILH